MISACLIKRAIDQSVVTKYPTRTTEVDQRNFFLFSRLKAHGGTGGNVQPHASRYCPNECERAIDFKKVIVAADLDRPITRVLNHNGQDTTSQIRFDLSGFDEVFAWVHCLGP